MDDAHKHGSIGYINDDSQFLDKEIYESQKHGYMNLRNMDIWISATWIYKQMIFMYLYM